MSHSSSESTPPETPGQRLYLIRLALGDGIKNPMLIDVFVALVKRRTGAVYDPSAISRSENGSRRLTLEDVANFAAVDPLHRGREWLGWGEAQAMSPPVPRRRHDTEAARRERDGETGERKKASGDRGHPKRPRDAR